MDWRTPAETEALLELVRTWMDAAAKIHGLTVVARTFLYRHGDLRAGQAVCRELLEASREYGSVTGQAYALVLLAELEAAFGDFEDVFEGRSRLSPDHDLAALGHVHRAATLCAHATEAAEMANEATRHHEVDEVTRCIDTVRLLIKKIDEIGDEVNPQS
jgi:hypothetical protein